MVWHNETVIGLAPAVVMLGQLFPELRPFGCIKIRTNEMALMVFEKPWPGPIFVVSGNLSQAQVRQLEGIGQELGLSVYANVPVKDGGRGLSFFSPVKTPDLADSCRRLLGPFANDSSQIVVQGMQIKVNDVDHFLPHNGF